MDKESWENYETSLEIMRDAKPNSSQLKVAKAVGILISFTAKELEDEIGIDARCVSKALRALYDGYGYEFNKVKLSSKGRIYRYSLQAVTLEPSETYIRNRMKQNEAKRARNKKHRPAPDISDFSALLNGVFA
jgi:transcription initiation factor IIE alpha subunit